MNQCFTEWNCMLLRTYQTFDFHYVDCISIYRRGVGYIYASWLFIGERERANPSRYNSSNFSILYIIYICRRLVVCAWAATPTAHMSSSPVVCSCKDHSRMNGNQRDSRTARGATGATREQYRQRHAAETADAREVRLECQRESARCRRAMESASDKNARLSQARRHQWRRVSTETSGERETRLQRLRAAQQLRLAAESRVAPARQTIIYIRLVYLHFSFFVCSSF